MDFKPLTKGRKVAVAAVTLMVVFLGTAALGGITNLNISAQSATPPTTLGEGAAGVVETDAASTSSATQASSTTTPATYPKTIGAGAAEGNSSALATTSSKSSTGEVVISFSDSNASKAKIIITPDKDSTIGSAITIGGVGDHDVSTVVTKNEDGTYSGTVDFGSATVEAGDQIAVTYNTTDADGDMEKRSAKTWVKDKHIDQLTKQGWLILTSESTDDVAKSDYSCDKLDEGLVKKYTSINIKKYVCGLLVWIGDWASNIAGNVIEWFAERITSWMTDRGQAMSGWVERGWGVSRSVVAIVAIIALLIISFANILHLNLNTYAVKRMLPRVVIALVAANLSLFLIRAMSSISFEIAESINQTATSGFVTLVGAIQDLITGVLLTGFGLDAAVGTVAVSAYFAGVTATGGAAAILPALLLAVILLAALVLGTVLAFLFLIQPAVVGILTILAPLAIVSSALPMTEKYFSKWLGMLFNWIFMFPVCLFLFALMNVFVTQVADSPFAQIAAIVADAFILLMAVRVPFSMGGDIAAGWAKVGKWTAGSIGSSIEARGARMVSEEKAKGTDKSWRHRLGQAIGAPRGYIMGFKARGEGNRKMAGAFGTTFSSAFSQVAGEIASLEDNLASDLEKMQMARPDTRAKKVAKAYEAAVALKDKKGFEGKDIDKIFKEMVEDVLGTKGKTGKAIALLKKYNISADDMSSFWGALNVTNQNFRRHMAAQAEAAAIENVAGPSAGAIFGGFEYDPNNPTGARRSGGGATPNAPIALPSTGEDVEDSAEAIVVGLDTEGAAAYERARSDIDHLTVREMKAENVQMSDVVGATTANKDEQDKTVALLRRMGSSDEGINRAIRAMRLTSEVDASRNRGTWSTTRGAIAQGFRQALVNTGMADNRADELLAEQQGGRSSLTSDDVVSLSQAQAVSPELKQALETSLARSRVAGMIASNTNFGHGVRSLTGGHDVSVLSDVICRLADLGVTATDLGGKIAEIDKVIADVASRSTPEEVVAARNNYIQANLKGKINIDLERALSSGGGLGGVDVKNSVMGELQQVKSAMEMARQNQQVLGLAAQNKAQTMGARTQMVSDAIRQQARFQATLAQDSTPKVV